MKSRMTRLTYNSKGTGSEAIEDSIFQDNALIFYYWFVCIEEINSLIQTQDEVNKCAWFIIKKGKIRILNGCVYIAQSQLKKLM